MRLKLIVFAGVLALGLAGCGGAGMAKPATAAATATERIDVVEQRYHQVKLMIEVMMPYLKPATRERFRSGFATIERAIAIARTATDAVARNAALREAVEETERISSSPPT